MNSEYFSFYLNVAFDLLESCKKCQCYYAEPQKIFHADGRITYRVGCPECGYMTEEKDSINESIEEWNKINKEGDIIMSNCEYYVPLKNTSDSEYNYSGMCHNPKSIYYCSCGGNKSFCVFYSEYKKLDFLKDKNPPAKCHCYSERVSSTGKKYGVCLGTKEIDHCSCGGDLSDCDFYPEYRKAMSRADDEELYIPYCAEASNDSEKPVFSKSTYHRKSKTQYYLDIAAEVAKRSTCLRRQYGAVIVKNDEIISTGYNGAPRGEENCCDKGVCWREANNIPHGEQYEKCVAVHAEQNAIISASRRDMIGATLYLSGWENGKRMSNPEPCEICARLIKNAGIISVINHSSTESEEDFTRSNNAIMYHHD